MGIPTLSLILVGAAPVPPRKPSIAIKSAPALTIPDAMADTLCTAAIFTPLAFYNLQPLSMRISTALNLLWNRYHDVGLER